MGYELFIISLNENTFTDAEFQIIHINLKQ